MVFSMFAKFQRKLEESPFSASESDPRCQAPHRGHPDLILHCQGGRCQAHQAVLVRSSSFIMDLMQEQHMDCVASRRIGVDIHLPDLEVNIINKLLEILYTGATVLGGLQETAKLKAAWKLLRIDVIQIKELEIIFETPDSSLPTLESENTRECKEKVDEKRKGTRWRKADKKIRMNMKVKKRINLKKLREKTSKKFVKGLEEFIVQTIGGKERQVETIETKLVCRKTPGDGSNIEQDNDKYSVSFMENLVYTSPSNIDFTENHTTLAPFEECEIATPFCDKLRPTEQVSDLKLPKQQQRAEEVVEPPTAKEVSSSTYKENESNHVPTTVSNDKGDEPYKLADKDHEDIRHNHLTKIKMGCLPTNQGINFEAVKECQYKGNDKIDKFLDTSFKSKDKVEEINVKTREHLVEVSISKKELRETVKTIVKETIQIKSPTEIFNFNDPQTLNSSSLVSRIMCSRSTGGMEIEHPKRCSSQLSPAFLEHSLASFSDVVAAVGLEPTPLKRLVPQPCPLITPDIDNQHVHQRKITSQSATSVFEEGQKSLDQFNLSESPLLPINSKIKDPLRKPTINVNQEPINSHDKYNNCDTEAETNENTIELVGIDDTGYDSEGNDSDDENGNHKCIGLSLDLKGKTMKSMEPKNMILSEKQLKRVSGEEMFQEFKSVEEIVKSPMITGEYTMKEHAAKEIITNLGCIKQKMGTSLLKLAASNDPTFELDKSDSLLNQTVLPARESNQIVNQMKFKARENDYSSSQNHVEAICHDKDKGCTKDIVEKGTVQAKKHESHPFKFNARNMLLSQTMLVDIDSKLSCDKKKLETSSGKHDQLSDAAQPGQCSEERKQTGFHQKSSSLCTEEPRGFSSFTACDTDGMALIPDIQDLNDCPDILESLMSVLECPDVSNDNNCVEDSMIKTPIEPETKTIGLHKDHHTSNRPMLKFKAPQKQPKYRPKYNNEKNKSKNTLDFPTSTPMQEKRRKKLTKEFSQFFEEEKQVNNKRKTCLDMEKPRYVLNHNIININSYKQNQSKLKIINRNKIDNSNSIFDKSNDVSLRKKFNIKRDIFVNVYNTSCTPKEQKISREMYQQKLKSASLVTTDIALRTSNCIVRSNVLSHNTPVGIIVENTISDKEKDSFKIPKLKIKICRT